MNEKLVEAWQANSALYWLPKIVGADLPTPATVVVPYDHHEALEILDGLKPAHWDTWAREVTEAAGAVGWPVFIRTDLASAKHEGPDAYKANGPADVSKILAATIEDNELKLWLDERPQAFLVRRFLDLNVIFTAFDGLPIAMEWRYFATAEQVMCRHFYWPEDAIQFWDAEEPEDWRRRLREMALLEPPPELAAWAVQAVKACPKAKSWSVDFAQDIDGQWSLIDMATADRSWHPAHEKGVMH